MAKDEAKSTQQFSINIEVVVFIVNQEEVARTVFNSSSSGLALSSAVM